MKPINKSTITIALITLVVGGLIGWLIKPSNDQTIESSDHEYVESGDQTWTCSMHPQIRQKEPGACPICGMDLIPLEDEQDELDPRAVSMSPTAMQLAQVRTLVVGKGDSHKSIRLTGKVQADERQLFTQTSHIPGRVEKLNVNFTGDYVNRGQVIALVYSPDLVTAQEELLEAAKIKDKQPSLFEAAKEKLKNWKLSDSQIDKIISTKKIMNEFPILANASGYVTKKLVNLGDHLKEGQPFYEIANLSKVWVLFDVYESDMQWIKKGDAIDYTIQSVPGKTYTGKISYIDPAIDPKTRVAKARVEVSNSDLKLKPEMFATGRIKSNTDKDNESLTVPKTAVMWTGKRSVVYVMNKDAIGISFIMREVTLGPELGEEFVIESGLTSGEEIAVNGTFSIDAAAQLAGKPSMMNPTGGVVMTGHDHGGSTEQKNMMSEVTKMSIDKSAKKALHPIYINYLKLKDALVGSNFEKAKSEAKMIKESLEAVDMTLFKGDAHNEWMKLLSQFNSSLEHVDHWTNIENVRSSFMPLSNSLIELTKAFSPFGQTLYVEYCPMADNNNGAYWLSQEEEIKNPYFGDAMLTCGNVEEELN